MATDDKKVAFPVEEGHEEHHDIFERHPNAKAALAAHAAVTHGFEHHGNSPGPEGLGEEDDHHEYRLGDHSVHISDDGAWMHGIRTHGGDPTGGREVTTGSGPKSLKAHLEEYKFPNEKSDVRTDVMKAAQGKTIPEDSVRTAPRYR